MATVYPNAKFTLLDTAKLASGDKIFNMIGVMNLEIDDFFMDVPMKECNMVLAHEFVRDVGMTSSQAVGFYQGTKPSKRSGQKVQEGVAMLSRRREIDCREIDRYGEEKGKELLKQQDEGHLQKLGEDVVNEFINGTVSSGSEHINGLKARLGALNPTGLNNVQSLGHASTGTSVYVVEWNPINDEGCYGIYPPGFKKNTKYGVKAENIGREAKADPDDTTATFYNYVAMFYAWFGLAVGNNRKIARLCNINPNIDGSKSFQDGGVEALIKLLGNGRFNVARTRIYVNPTVRTQMDIYALNKNNIQWPTMEVFGRTVPQFRGIPIRVTDVISDAETLVA